MKIPYRIIVLMLLIIGSTLHATTPNSLSPLPPQDILRLETATPIVQLIITKIIIGKLEITPKVKSAFWEQFNYISPLTPDTKKRIKDQLIGPHIILLSYFYKDMLTSLYLELPFKSEEHQRYENYLESLGSITEKTLQEHEKLAQDILGMQSQEKKTRGTTQNTRENVEKLMKIAIEKEGRINPLFE